jgi:hypothetical protein
MVGYEYDQGDEKDRRFQESEMLRDVLSGSSARHNYPRDLGKSHLTVWRGVDRCLIGVATDEGLGSVQDDEIGGIVGDMEAFPDRFLPRPDELLLRYLTAHEDLTNQEGDSERVQIIEHITGEMAIDLGLFRRLRDFVLREGHPLPAQPLPASYQLKGRGLCHWESLRLSRSSGLVYVEGFALTDRAKVATLHGWCIDGGGRVIDCTWSNRGIAYFGIPIHPEYARRKLELFEAMPSGSTAASLLNDRTDNWAILNGNVQDWKIC